jgi:hypothetical protein
VTYQLELLSRYLTVTLLTAFGSDSKRVKNNTASCAQEQIHSLATAAATVLRPRGAA